MKFQARNELLPPEGKGFHSELIKVMYCGIPFL